MALSGGRKRESSSGAEVRHYDETAAREQLIRGLETLRMDLAAIRLLRPSDPRKQALCGGDRSPTSGFSAGAESITLHRVLVSSLPCQFFALPYTART